MMASDDKAIKGDSTAKKEASPETKSATGTESPKPGEKPSTTPSNYSRGEGQKPVSNAYRENWSVIFGKKRKRASRSR
jgi:hypothetical protein